MKTPEQVMGATAKASPRHREKFRRLKVIQSMPDKTIDDLASILGVRLDEVRSLCQALGDERALG